MSAVFFGMLCVKAIFSTLSELPTDAASEVPIFLAGKDTAVAKVADMVRQPTFAGREVKNCGGIEAARLTEPAGMLNIRPGSRWCRRLSAIRSCPRLISESSRPYSNPPFG